MAVVKVKPTSPGRRAVVKVVHKHLHKGAPEASLLEPQKQNSGRNNNGHITMRHKGGGHKHHYRVVDFRRDKDGIPAKVERIEYDPNRNCRIALLHYLDGEKRYILAPRNVQVGDRLQSGQGADEIFAGYHGHRLPPATPYRNYVSWLADLDHDAAGTAWGELLRGIDTPTLVGPALVDTEVDGVSGAETKPRQRPRSRA